MLTSIWCYRLLRWWGRFFSHRDAITSCWHPLMDKRGSDSSAYGCKNLCLYVHRHGWTVTRSCDHLRRWSYDDGEAKETATATVQTAESVYSHSRESAWRLTLARLQHLHDLWWREGKTQRPCMSRQRLRRVTYPIRLKLSTFLELCYGFAVKSHLAL